MIWISTISICFLTIAILFLSKLSSKILRHNPTFNPNKILALVRWLPDYYQGWFP